MLFFKDPRKEDLETLQITLLRAFTETRSREPFPEDDVRSEARVPKLMPVLLMAHDNGSPSIARAIFAVTKDVTSHSLAAVTNELLDAEDVIVAFLVDRTLILALGKVQAVRQIGGGFRQFGIELFKLAEPGDVELCEEIVRLVTSLAPPATIDSQTPECVPA